MECTDKTVQGAKTEGTQTNATNAEATKAAVQYPKLAGIVKRLVCCGTPSTKQKTTVQTTPTTKETNPNNRPENNSSNRSKTLQSKPHQQNRRQQFQRLLRPKKAKPTNKPGNNRSNRINGKKFNVFVDGPYTHTHTPSRSWV